MDDMISYLKDTLKIPSKKTLVLSVSGGMDSMALLHLLSKSDFKIAVVHFNHQKRTESIIEKDMVENYAKTLDLPFHYYTIQINDGNFHHEAHHLRYHYLKEVAKLYHTPYILTAHHLDDLFENVLIKLTRGSNLLGYAGMQIVYQDDRYTYIKPLLYTSKDDIKAYVKKHDVPYLEDESNDTHLYLRNRYRHAVVPIMKQENEDLLSKIKDFHVQLSQAFKYIRQQTEKLMPDKNMIHIPLFKEQDDVIQEDMIAYLIQQNKLSSSYETILKIKEMLKNKKPNATYLLSSEHELIKSYEEAFIKPISTLKNKVYQLKEGENKLSNMAIFTFLTKTNSNTAEFTKLCYNKLAFPLWLRHRNPGDMLAYSYGHKKLKKLLIDKKVPMKKRDALWVLTDNNHQVLWVESFYLNETLGDQECLYFKLKEVKKHA
ncbi:MAG: tRNA lysidine(34) synthetase TilS [Tenericutes bacterium HGW-Tenericutes-6]|nr:MAG: tRNA lysidine(34) synthetase TilS [Tenericutes bacterium HGW-Tenericutes-6]